MIGTLSSILPLSLEHLAATAESKIGACESPRGSNRGPDLAEFFAADNYTPGNSPRTDSGYPWCAAFVCWCVQEWLRNDASARSTFAHITPPRTAAAFGLIDWARAQHGTVQIHTGQPRRSDIVVFNFSHCGIVTAADPAHFVAVEGNTDDGGSREGWRVARRKRIPRDVRAFIRFIPIARRIS